MVQSPAGARDFSLLCNIQTDFEAHPASHLPDSKGYLPRVKWQGRETDHSSPSSAKVKNNGVILSLPHLFSCHGA
jgi:hypothetical protein